MIIQTRIKYLLSATIAVFAIVLLGNEYIKSSQKKEFIAANEQSKSVAIQNILKFKTKSFLDLAKDYTTWDEMIKYTETPTKKWTDINITTISAFDVSCTWIYNKNLQLIYSVFKSTEIQKPINLPQKTIKYLLLNKKFCHFFFTQNDSIFEITGATIVPTADIEHKTAANGYFLIAKLWNKKFISGLEQEVDFKINIQKANSFPTDKQKDYSENVITKIFYDVFDKPILKVDFVSTNSLVVSFSATDKMSYVFIALLILIFVIFYLAIRFWLIEPLRQITIGLKEEKEIDQNKFERNNEFREIAALTHTFFQQKVELKAEIEERKRAQNILTESRATLAAIIENTSDAIWAISPAYEIVYLNSVMEGIFYARFGIFLAPSMNHLSLLPEEEKEQWKKHYDLALQNEYFMFEDEIKGSQFSMNIEVAMHPIVTEGNVIGVSCFLRDITERKNAENELRSSEKRFRSLFENASVGFYKSSLSGNLLLCNQAALDILGFDSLEDMGNISHEKRGYQSSSSADLFQKIMFEKEEVRGFEAIWTKKNGDPICIRESAHLVKDANGVPLFYEGTFEDFTDHKQAEMALKMSQERNHALLKANPDMMFVFNRNHLFVDFYLSNNPNSIVSQATLLGKKPVEVLPAAVAELTNQKLDAVFETKEMQIFEYSLGENNQIRHYEGRMVLSGPNEALAIVRDITERKLAEDNLIKLSRAVEQSPASIIITDLNGNIEYVNQKFSVISGYSYEEVKGKNPRFLQSEIQPKIDYSNLWMALKEGKTWTGEFHNKKKNGELFWENASLSPIVDNHGQIRYYIAIKEDITEKKQILELLIQAKDKAEESDQLKTAFLENISHEVRTPMNAIMGFSNLLLQPNFIEEHRKSFTQILHKSINQLLTIVENIITVAHIETNQLLISKTHFNPNILLTTLYDEFNTNKRIVEGSNIDLRLAKTDLRNIQILSDYTRLNQVFYTLLDNAFKFTEEGAIEFGYTIENERINFYVKDTGIGIPDDKQAIIFKSFMQADKNTRQLFGGLGVGLSIALGLIKLLESDITIVSKVNLGTTISFSFPVIIHPE